MSDRTWIGTSWKMTKTIGEAVAYARELRPEAVPDGVQPFVLPAHTGLAAVRDALPAGSPVLLGAQNAHWAAEGAGTGEVSMRMVADAGAVVVELGHSERRAAFGETDGTVARKVRAALDAGLTPLVCVGETAEVRDAGRAVEHVAGQVRAALAHVARDEVPRVLLAYEPVWAIGTGGRAAALGEVSPVLAEVAGLVRGLGAGTGCRALLYGGSVDRANAAGLLADAHVDGLFVGRAAWDVAGFLGLLRIASGVAGRG
ncbi:triose-phosphate isomerase [Myceligenerans cantabricum]